MEKGAYRNRFRVRCQLFQEDGRKQEESHAGRGQQRCLMQLLTADRSGGKKEKHRSKFLYYSKADHQSKERAATRRLTRPASSQYQNKFIWACVLYLPKNKLRWPAQMPTIELKLQYQLGIYYQFSNGMNLVIQFYFVYPTIYVPAGEAWTLPNAEFSPLVLPNPHEENLGCWKQTFAETILLKHCEESYKDSVVCLETKKPSAPSSKQKTFPRDEDYQPELYVSKKSKKSQQLENRNVVPNIIRLVLSFIQKKGKSCSIVEKLLRRSGVEKGWSSKRFYLYQSMIRGKMNNYVNEETLRNLVKSHPEQSELYPMAEQEFYNKITRTIIDYFLREEISVCVLTSKRMDKTKKTHHLNAIRNIRNALPTILRQ